MATGQKELSNPQVPGWLKMGKSNELSSDDGLRNLARARPRLRSGRFWQVRRDELDRRIFKDVACIRRLQSPTLWEVGVCSTLLRAEHASMWEIPHE